MLKKVLLIFLKASTLTCLLCRKQNFKQGKSILSFHNIPAIGAMLRKKGYSGTAVFSKHQPLQEIHELGVPELDLEGRVVALEFERFWFVCLYA